MSAIFQKLPPEGEALVKTSLEALRSRGVQDDYCPKCKTNDWNVDAIAIPAASLPSPALTRVVTPFRMTGYIPLLNIVCKNCGYTMLHNLNVLEIKTE